MSEVNTYKKIVDVEQVETLNDAATVFINDNGAMKQVSASAIGGQGAGGSGGAFVVNLTPLAEGMYLLFVPDKTFDQILAACKAGQTVVFRNENADEYGNAEIVTVNGYYYDGEEGFIQAGRIGYTGTGMKLVTYEFELGHDVARHEHTIESLQ